MLFELALILVDGIGPITARNLISACGSAEAVFREKPSHLLGVSGVFPNSLRSIRKAETMSRAEQELKFIKANEIRALLYTDQDYPNRLKFCDDSPLILFTKGDVNLNAERMVAIVGTRSASDYGTSICREIVEQLAPYQPVIISGLALGIDTVAHKAALEFGLQTVATLAHGLDRIYPSENKKLANLMLNTGGLVTEIFSQNMPDRENFPKRNRIVAGMTQSTIVVESASKGGSIITANLAFDYSRDVFAIPGRLSDKSFSGCNKLIATNRAAMFTSVHDFATQMGWEDKKSRSVQSNLFFNLNETEQKIVGYIQPRSMVQLDTMSLDLQLPISRLNAELMSMELKGLVKAFPGKKFGLFAL